MQANSTSKIPPIESSREAVPLILATPYLALVVQVLRALGVKILLREIEKPCSPRK